MGKLSTFIVGSLVVLMAMPANLGDLAHGSFQLSVTPLVLVLALACGTGWAFARVGETKAVLGGLNRWLLGFLLLATVSTLWSADPDATLHRLFRLYSQMMACLLFVLAGWHPRRFQRVVLPALVFLDVISILYFLVDPVGAIQPSKFGDLIAPELVDAWRGVTLHKNTLGAVAASTVILSVHALLARQKNFFAVLPGLAAAVVCLVGSRSSTATFSAIFAVALLWLILRPPSGRWRRLTPLLATTLAGLLLVYSLGVLNVIPGLSSVIEPIVALTGKDMTFSGRTTIWAIMNMEIAKHPLLGIGYAAFWTSQEPSSPSYEFFDLMYIWPGEAHNGYLDVINELGFAGGALLVAYLYVFLRQSLRLLTYDRSQGALYLGLLFAEFIGNLSEAHWWNLANVHFFLITLATFDLARALHHAQTRPAAAVPDPGPEPLHPRGRGRSAFRPPPPDLPSPST